MGEKTSKIRLWAVIFWLAVWQLAAMGLARAYPHGSLLMASPAAVLYRLGQLAVPAAFWQTVGWSAARIFGGFLLSALLAAQHFSEPFKDSNGYGESIARLSNMLGGGVIIQRFGDLIRGRRSTPERMEDAFITPTLNATPGDLSLVLPKRILDDIVEMIYALDKIAPGTANEDTLLYGVEVKFYNMEVEVNKKLESNQHPGLYIIGDGSGITHSLSHASASGVYVARNILE